MCFSVAISLTRQLWTQSPSFSTKLVASHKCADPKDVLLLSSSLNLWMHAQRHLTNWPTKNLTDRFLDLPLPNQKEVDEEVVADVKSSLNLTPALLATSLEAPKKKISKNYFATTTTLRSDSPLVKDSPLSLSTPTKVPKRP